MAIRRPTTFIFDFDGTIADSMKHVIEIYNRIAERFDVPEVGASDIERIRRMTPNQVMQHYGIPIWKVPTILSAVRSELHAHVDRLEPFAGIREVLLDLRQAGARCLLLSSNSKRNVEAFLTYHEMSLFEYLACGSSLFGKATRLRRVLAHFGMAASEAAYVGDEIRDIEAAKRANVYSIAVSWGYAARDALLQAKPDCLIDNPRDLLGVHTGSREAITRGAKPRHLR